ncbi:Histidine kinase superfamily protein [Desulfonema limicola]|uniref:Histidine kinase superfamily protein n=1 Tax=Desulfonema limicola TaxID=45656 RepID=A0A975BA81_9BACT|nr:HAMP domain-containing sensor histidine kinase [Desulfonema limicola]QTA81606.1 Histidine kinase superfamily protein [Desulfonema limicola]
MKNQKLMEKSLSPERKQLKEVFEQAQYFTNIQFFKNLIDSLYDIVMILNKNRQIVFANKTLFEKFELEEKNVYGSRPGETLGCIHAFKEHGGCGTSNYCRSCGAAKAIYSSLANKSDIQECRISRKGTLSSLDIKVKTVPAFVHNEQFIIFIITDISHEKRRKAFERIFFHDIMNLAGGIRGLSQLLNLGHEDKRKEYEEHLIRNSDLLINEINAHKLLTQAENRELEVQTILINSGKIIDDAADIYKYHNAAYQKHIHKDENALHIDFYSDPVLLQRVLSNMIKNALEASKPGETITIGCDLMDQNIQFWVHNPGVMPEDVQLQIFQRSFSTKGKGRGLGTYSMMLLTEWYLKGNLSFISSEKKGTIFRASYPLSDNFKNI